MPLGATVINAIIQGEAMSVVIVTTLGLNELSCLLELPFIHSRKPLNLHFQRW